MLHKKVGVMFWKYGSSDAVSKMPVTKKWCADFIYGGRNIAAISKWRSRCAGRRFFCSDISKNSHAKNWGTKKKSRVKPASTSTAKIESVPHSPQKSCKFWSILSGRFLQQIIQKGFEAYMIQQIHIKKSSP